MSSYWEPVPGDERGEEARLLERIADRRKRRRKPSHVGLNVTPMIDIVFQLIIFFMLVSEFQNMELEQITLPYAVKAKEEPIVERRLVINVNARGEVMVMRRPYAPDELEGLLARRAHANVGEDGCPDVAVKIRADAECRYVHVQRVMVMCMEKGIWRLSFGASHTEDEGALVF